MGCHDLYVVTATCMVRNSQGFQMLQAKTNQTWATAHKLKANNKQNKPNH